MTKSNLLMLTGVGLLLSAGLVEACGSSTHFVDVPDDSAGSSSAGKTSRAGAPGSAGESSDAGEPATDGGAAGSSEPAEGGEGGAVEVAGGAATAGTAGLASGGGGSGGTSGGGAGGAGGGAGKGGSGGTAGSGGLGGSAGKGGSGGSAGSSAGSAGAGGAPLFLPASTTCSAGNVQAAFTVCRNCHVDGGEGPFPLVTLANIQALKGDIPDAIGPVGTVGVMPKVGTLSDTNKAIILNWIAAGALGVTNASCP